MPIDRILFTNARARAERELVSFRFVLWFGGGALGLANTRELCVAKYMFDSLVRHSYLHDFVSRGSMPRLHRSILNAAGHLPSPSPSLSLTGTHTQTRTQTLSSTTAKTLKRFFPRCVPLFPATHEGPRTRADARPHTMVVVPELLGGRPGLALGAPPQEMSEMSWKKNFPSQIFHKHFHKIS